VETFFSHTLAINNNTKAFIFLKQFIYKYALKNKITKVFALHQNSDKSNMASY